MSVRDAGLRFLPSTTSGAEMSAVTALVHDMPRHIIVAALFLLAAAGCTQSMTEWEKDYEAARRQNEARALQQAAQKAQATLDDFLVKAKQPPVGTKSYAVMVGVQDGRDTEYFWVDEFTWSDGVFTGRINHEPRLVKRIKAGQIHRFGRSDIVDWTYVDEKSGRTFGHFTACARPNPDALERRNDPQCR